MQLFINNDFAVQLRLLLVTFVLNSKLIYYSYEDIICVKFFFFFCPGAGLVILELICPYKS